MLLRNSESPFSIQYATLTADGKHCWICLFPIGRKNDPDPLRRSRDHVIPISDGGHHVQHNIRWAHKWCNSHRRSRALSPEVIAECRAYVVAAHGRWLRFTAHYCGPIEEDTRVMEIWEGLVGLVGSWSADTVVGWKERTMRDERDVAKDPRIGDVVGNREVIGFPIYCLRRCVKWQRTTSEHGGVCEFAGWKRFARGKEVFNRAAEVIG